MRVILAACLALASVGFAGEGVLAPLLDRLRAGEPGATAELAQAGPTAAEPLLDLVADRDPAVGWRALSALRRLVARTTDDGDRARLAGLFVARLAAERPLAERRAAAELLGRLGSAAHVDALAPLLENRELFDTAAQALAQIPGEEARTTLVNALARPRPAEQTALLIELLAARGEPANLEVFRAAATVENDVVRAAAAKALGSLGEPAAAKPLLALLRSKSLRVRLAALEAAIGLAQALDRKGEGQAASDLAWRAYEAARSDAERAVALPGLATVVGRGALREVERGMGSREAKFRHAAVVALSRIEGPAADELVVQGARSARDDIRPLLFAEVGRREIATAAPVLLEAARERDEGVALGALAALGQVAQPSLAGAVLNVAKGATGSAAVRAKAFRLALRLADALASGGRGDRAVEVFAQALKLARNQRERRSAVLGLARTARAEVLDVIEPILDNPDDPQRSIALRACVAVGDAAARRGERSRAVAAYRRALRAQADFVPAILALARLGIHPEMAALNGCLATWWVIGPFPCANLRDAPLKPWFPEEEIALGKTYEVQGRRLRWRPIHSDHEKGWIILKGKVRPSNRVLAYAYTTLTLPKPTDAILAFGRDDGLTLWVNGQVLYNEHGPSGIGSREETVQAHLVAGENRILVKCSQGGGDWGFYLRVTTPDGKALPTD